MNILLAVSGSISAYKTFDLLRSLYKKGHQVRVILTNGALKFIKPELFYYLGAEKVYSPEDDFNLKVSTNVLHIELANWCDRFVLAPASANTLANLAQGKANDLLSSVFLAMDQSKPQLFFPAMNTKMLNHPFTQDNLKKIASLENSYIAPTAAGELACGEIGEGKLLDVESISDLIETYARAKKESILISTGATIAPIDPVRFVTNASSGITGYFIAKEALKKGHPVVIIAGKHATDKLLRLKGHPNFKLIRTTTTGDMAKVVKEEFPKVSSYISAAAISDFKFSVNTEKLKKETIKSALPFEKDIDILKETISLKKPHQKIIGFAAENPISKEILLQKWERKNVDLLIGTKVHNGLNNKDELAGFNTLEAEYSILENKEIVKSGPLSKQELAQYIVKKL